LYIKPGAVRAYARRSDKRGKPVRCSREFLAALDRLKMLYGGRSAQASAPQAATQRRGEEGQALLESDTGIIPPFTSEDLELKMGTNGWRDRLLRNARKGKAIRQVVEALTGNGREPE